MPQPGKCWRHSIIGTHGSWLPGSPKGWRSRNHKIHSSGDYKQPPPEGEHAALYEYFLKQCPEAVVIPRPLREIVGKAFINELKERSHQVLAIAVASQHCHFLAELPVDKKEMQAEVGHAKRKSSRSVKADMPGTLWASGGKFIVIDNEAYQRRVFDYIVRHKQEGAWIWTFRDEVGD